MKVVKFNTEHLVCYLQNSLLGQEHYQIYEKGNDTSPIVIYINEDDVKISEKLPEDVRKYKFFNELCDIVELLKGENNG